jgi:hypothetical protein
MPSLKIHRRAVLRGALGGVAIGVGLPPLEAMFNANGTAYAAGGSLPKRMGVFFWGDGVKPDQWVPFDEGANWAPSPELTPLKDLGVQDYVNVVSGMDLKTMTTRGHHAGTCGILSAAPLVVQPAGSAPFRSTFSKPSIDQVAAAVIGTKSRFRSLELGISPAVNDLEGTTLRYLSHNGPDNANPAEYDLSRFFNRVFGSGFVVPSANAPAVMDATLAYRKSVLDVVLGDLNRLRAQVGSADKLRLDQHLTNIRTIENRLTMTNTVMAGASCKMPTLMANTFVDANGREMIEEKTKAMSDLLAVALACDQTRVFSIQFTGSTARTVFWQVNAGMGHHDLTHNEPGLQPLVHATTVFTVKMFATLLQSLKAVPEGAGNLLDNCAIVATTDTSDGRFHNVKDYPILIAGGGGGFLKHPGIHYRSQTSENTSTALLSVLRAAGTNLNSFGFDLGLATTSCTAIEA